MTVSGSRPSARPRPDPASKRPKRARKPSRPSMTTTRAFDERDDRPITDSRLPRWLTMLPVCLVIGGLLSLVFGAFVGIVVLEPRTHFDASRRCVVHDGADHCGRHRARSGRTS